MCLVVVRDTSVRILSWLCLACSIEAEKRFDRTKRTSGGSGGRKSRMIFCLAKVYYGLPQTQIRTNSKKREKSVKIKYCRQHAAAVSVKMSFKKQVVAGN